MTFDEFLTILKQGGGTIALLALLMFAVVKIFGGAIRDAIVKFFTSLLAEMQGMRKTIDDHTKTDIEHHADVKQSVAELRTDVAALQATVDTAFDLTPRPPKSHTTPRGVPVGYYGPRRPGTKDDR